MESRRHATSQDKAAFVRRILPYAVAAAKELGISPRLIIAQAAHESNYGLSAPGNNYFGIKATAKEKSAGRKSVNLRTWEEINGAQVNQYAAFRTYANLGESVAGYVRLLKTNKIYAPVLASGNNFEKNAEAMAKSPYSTDPIYKNKLLGVDKGLAAYLPKEFGGAETALPAAPNGGQKLTAQGVLAGGSENGRQNGAGIESPMALGLLRARQSADQAANAGNIWGNGGWGGQAPLSAARQGADIEPLSERERVRQGANIDIWPFLPPNALKTDADYRAWEGAPGAGSPVSGQTGQESQAGRADWPQQFSGGNYGFSYIPETAPLSEQSGARQGAGIEPPLSEQSGTRQGAGIEPLSGSAVGQSAGQGASAAGGNIWDNISNLPMAGRSAFNGGGQSFPISAENLPDSFSPVNFSAVNPSDNSAAGNLPDMGSDSRFWQALGGGALPANAAADSRLRQAVANSADERAQASETRRGNKADERGQASETRRGNRDAESQAQASEAGRQQQSAAGQGASANIKPLSERERVRQGANIDIWPFLPPNALNTDADYRAWQGVPGAGSPISGQTGQESQAGQNFPAAAGGNIWADRGGLVSAAAALINKASPADKGFIAEAEPAFAAPQARAAADKGGQSSALAAPLRFGNDAAKAAQNSGADEAAADISTLLGAQPGTYIFPQFGTNKLKGFN